MQRYADWAPTAFDCRGAFLEDRQDWLVLPVLRTRDSGPLEVSNFETARTMLEECPEDSWETHSFNHWGPGWVEVIIVAPDSQAAAVGLDIEAALENYPVLDDEDFSRREWEESEQDWDNWARKDFLRILSDWFADDGCAAMRFLDEVVDSADLRRFCDEHSSQYVPIDLRSFHGTRKDLAVFLRAQRVAKNPRIGFRDPCQLSLFE